MTLQQLKYMIEIVNSGSMNAAAEKLFITQPSLSSAVRELEKELGREPVMEEIAQSAQLSVDEVVMSLESGAEVESLHKIIYQGDGNDISLMDRLQEKENGQDAALNRIFLDEILKKLDARERQLIYMRYFKDMTQTEIAAEMGISQVQVSRMEKRILKQLKDQT